MKQVLDRIQRLARIRVGEDAPGLASHLTQILDYVGELDKIGLDIPPMSSSHVLSPVVNETEPSSAALPDVDTTLLKHNIPEFEDECVMVPVFVERK